jgi:hypothetical protein
LSDDGLLGVVVYFYAPGEAGAHARRYIWGYDFYWSTGRAYGGVDELDVLKFKRKRPKARLLRGVWVSNSQMKDAIAAMTAAKVL